MQQPPFDLMDMETYLDQVIEIIEHLRPDIVIHRVTGDGAKDQLIGPRWILNKRKVLNSLMGYMRTRQTYQGKFLI
jgi:radical SAM superfamily enzyme